MRHKPIHFLKNGSVNILIVEDDLIPRYVSWKRLLPVEGWLVWFFAVFVPVGALSNGAIIDLTLFYIYLAKPMWWLRLKNVEGRPWMVMMVYIWCPKTVRYVGEVGKVVCGLRKGGNTLEDEGAGGLFATKMRCMYGSRSVRMPSVGIKYC